MIKEFSQGTYYPANLLNKRLEEKCLPFGKEMGQICRFKSVLRAYINLTHAMRLLPSTRATLGKPLQFRLPVLKNLVSSLILHEQILTTRARAKAIRPIAELVRSNLFFIIALLSLILFRLVDSKRKGK